MLTCLSPSVYPFVPFLATLDMWSSSCFPHYCSCFQERLHTASPTRAHRLVKALAGQTDDAPPHSNTPLHTAGQLSARGAPKSRVQREQSAWRLLSPSAGLSALTSACARCSSCHHSTTFFSSSPSGVCPCIFIFYFLSYGDAYVHKDRSCI